VRRRRLEERRTALLANLSRPVTDMAFACIALARGFGGLPSFDRAFRAEFGLSTSDRRHAARTSAPVETNAENEMRSRREREARTVTSQ
jgi:transcriptional regulator GlxA family with amidase domain